MGELWVSWVPHVAVLLLFGSVRAGDLGTWNGALGGYVSAMKAAGRAAGTIRLHRHYLSGLAGVHRRPWAVTGAQLVAYVAHEGWAPETRKSCRTVVAGFYRWGHGAGLVEENPALALPTVRVPAGVPRPAPELVVRRLLHAEDRVGFMGMLAAYGGLRAGEIARVHGDEYDGPFLLVHGKGGKDRVVPVTNPRLDARLRAVDGWAFPNGLGSHLTPGHVSRLVSAALPGEWTAHTLRHRMATQAHRGGADLFALSRVLGHARVETTQRYVLLDTDELVAVARAAELVG